MLKKAIFIGPAFPYRGGIAAFNENLAATFQNNGWECKMYTFTQQYPNLLFPGKNQYAIDGNKPNLSIKRAIFSTNPLNWLKISKDIIKEKPDVVITQYWMPFMAPAFGTILRGIKKGLKDTLCVTIVHNFKAHERWIGDKQLNKFVANRTDILISLSESVREDIKESLPNKRIISLFHPIYDHYGKKIDMARAKENLGLEEDCQYFLFFGLIRAYKGLDLLIEALYKVKSDKKFKLLIAGEFYEDEKKYRKLISELELEDKIIIRNEYIPDFEVPNYFCACSAVILPYRTATQSGVVPVAIHFEKPVIVTEVGSLSEIINKHEIGMICNTNPDDIADKIDLFLKNPNLLNGDFGEIRSELSWQSFFDTFIKEISTYDF